MSTTTIWTTELVDQTLEKLRYGMDVDVGCFHEKDIELKAGKILFKLTQEELAEFQKCSGDIIHFVSKYCRFMTDAGRTTVKLRDFQREILEELSEEEWKQEIQDIGPVARDYILMAARQTGKCFFNSDVEIQEKNLSKIKTPLNLLYYIHKEELTFLEKLKFKLMMLYNKIDKW